MKKWAKYDVGTEISEIIDAQLKLYNMTLENNFAWQSNLTIPVTTFIQWELYSSDNYHVWLTLWSEIAEMLSDW